MKTYKDIFGWFPEESAKTLRKLMKEHDVKTVIEVGSFLGKSTNFFASEGANVHAVDPFIKWKDKDRPNGDIEREGGDDFLEKFVANCIECGNAEKIYPHQETSEEAAKYVEAADMVYIDGLHDYESVKKDIKLWRNKATKIICGDDYDENWPGVMEAVKVSFQGRIKVCFEGRIWYVIK